MKAEDAQWHYVINGERRGPIIGRFLSTAQVRPNTLVWCRGMPDWKAAKDTPLGDFLFGVPPPINAPVEIALTEPEGSQPEPPPISFPLADSSSSDVKPKENYISRHWRGNMSLAQSFWVNVILVTLLLNSLMFGIPLLNLELRLLAFSAITYVIIVYALAVWQSVGLIRSLRKHIERGGSVGGLVLGWIGLGVLVFSIFSTSVATIFPLTGEMMEILRGDKKLGALKIELLPSGTEVEISGGISAGSAAEFRMFLANAPRVKILHIDSFGGRVHEAQAIAEIVSERQMTTFVSGKCLSAATLIFLAGHERFAQMGAKIGFHAAGLNGIPINEAAKANNAIGRRMIAAGVKAEFVAKVKSTPSTSMWYPTVEELLDARVITAPTTPRSRPFSTSSTPRPPPASR